MYRLQIFMVFTCARILLQHSQQKIKILWTSMSFLLYQSCHPTQHSKLIGGISLHFHTRTRPVQYCSTVVTLTRTSYTGTRYILYYTIFSILYCTVVFLSTVFLYSIPVLYISIPYFNILIYFLSHNLENPTRQERERVEFTAYNRHSNMCYF